MIFRSKFIVLALAALAQGNVFAEDAKKSTCIQLLGAGLYNGFLEENCNFQGNVSSNIRAVYTQGGCRSIVAQSEVDKLVGDVFEDSRTRYQEMGKGRFCSGNKTTYEELKASFSSQTQKTTKSPGIPLKKGLPYEKSKPALLKAGWTPVEFKDNNQELPEIEFCQQGGSGRCGIWLTAGKGSYLSITTTNDGYEILSWKKAAALPSD